MLRIVFPSFKAVRRKIKYRILYHAVNAAIYFSNLLPRNAWLHFCGTMGKMVSLLVPKLNRQITRHLMIAYAGVKTTSEIKDLAQKVFIMLGKNAGLVLRNFTTSTSNFYAQSITRGEEYAEEAFKR